MRPWTPMLLSISIRQISKIFYLTDLRNSGCTNLFEIKSWKNTRIKYKVGHLEAIPLPGHYFEMIACLNSMVKPADNAV